MLLEEANRGGLGKPKEKAREKDNGLWSGGHMGISTATLAMSTTQLASPFTLHRPSAAVTSPPPLSFSLLLRRPCFPQLFPRPVSASAAEEPSTAVAAGQEEGNGEAGGQGTTESDEDFEARLAKLQRKLTSGSGKKAERRKARKSGEGVSFSSAASSSKGGGVLLPPVPLSDAISDGLPVGLGFNSYTERVNGRFAALGLAAFLLVELATGGSFLKYHETAVIGLQAYFMLSVSAVFIKYEKEKRSVWPES